MEGDAWELQDVEQSLIKMLQVIFFPFPSLFCGPVNAEMGPQWEETIK